jgi:hypothetical protein
MNFNGPQIDMQKKLKDEIRNTYLMAQPFLMGGIRITWMKTGRVMGVTMIGGTFND